MIWQLEAGRRLPRIDTVIRLVGALEATPNELVAGIAWEPPKRILTPGGFEVSEERPLAAEVATLRERGRQT